MKTNIKYYKDRQFEGRCNMSFELRIDDMKKVNNWTDEQKDEAIDILNRAKHEIELSIARFKQNKLT